MLVLLFITPVFERVPYNAMGAIVLSSVIGLLDIAEARFLFKANFLDFLVWMAAFLGTVFLGVEIGLAIAIGLAVVLVVYQSAFPHTAVLGCLPETGQLSMVMSCSFFVHCLSDLLTLSLCSKVSPSLRMSHCLAWTQCEPQRQCVQ